MCLQYRRHELFAMFLEAFLSFYMFFTYKIIFMKSCDAPIEQGIKNFFIKLGNRELHH